MCDQMKFEMPGDYSLPPCDQCEMPPQRQQQQHEAQSQTNYCNMSQCPPSESCEQQYCDPCFSSCEPMCCPPPPCGPQQQSFNDFSFQAHENIGEPCVNVCSKPPSRRRRYVQPPRRQSFKPNLYYKRPEIPMSDDTIYRRSFEHVDPCMAACCRVPPTRPTGSLRTPCAKFEDETITSLSFQKYCRPERVRPIIPQSRSVMVGKGPMQGLTTQRHDFVPKFQYRRTRLVPRDNLKRLNACFERETVQRLSFMPPCANSRTQSFRPANSYKKPELPMEFETVHTLSYTPVCPSPRSDMPWAEKGKYMTPTVPFATDTITKLSYPPPGCYVDDEGGCCYDPCNEDCCYDSSPRAAM